MLANKITYEDAIKNIQAMFGPEIERDTIIALLQANNGVVEKTVEDIPIMTSGGGDARAPTIAASPKPKLSSQGGLIEVEDTFVGVWQYQTL
jgi:hypothetical protein